jgi:hypothetical protein
MLDFPPCAGIISAHGGPRNILGSCSGTPKKKQDRCRIDRVRQTAMPLDGKSKEDHGGQCDEPKAGVGSLEAVESASADLIREEGPLGDPLTDRETAAEVAELAALLVAYACVPADASRPPEGQNRRRRPRRVNPTRTTK